jgi:hypothetical protein
MDWSPEESELIPDSDKRFFSSPRRPDRHCGPPSLLSDGYWGAFPGVKCPEPEADHSPPSGANAMNAWSCTSSFLYAFIAWCLLEHRKNFIIRSVYILFIFFILHVTERSTLLLIQESRVQISARRLRFPVVFLTPSRQVTGQYLRLGHGHFLSHFFPIHYLLITPSVL